MLTPGMEFSTQAAFRVAWSLRGQNKCRPNPRALLCLCGLKNKAAIAHNEQLSDLDLEANEWCMQVGSPS